MLPHVSQDENGFVTLEWWNGYKKLTLYLNSSPEEQLLKVWGVNINTQMEFVDSRGITAVREAFEWFEASGA